jgi:hypothetical protein
VISLNRWASRYYVGPKTDHTQPLVRFLFPVLDTPADMAVSTQDNHTNNAVAVLGMTFLWQSLFGPYYTFSIYPSQAMEAQFKSSNLFIFTSATSTIFMFISIMF